jgi:SPP1 family phage portal protein
LFGIINKIKSFFKKGGDNVPILEKNLLELEIRDFKQSQKRKNMIDGENYHDGVHDILKRKRQVIGEGGILVTVENLPNNRIVDNQYGKLVDQKVNYLFGKPLTITSDNKQYEEAVQTIFDSRFQRTLNYVASDSYDGGIGWIHPHYNDNGELSFARYKPYEVIPFWKDAEATWLDFAIRIYEVSIYQNGKKTLKEKVEVIDANGTHKFDLVKGALIPDALNPYIAHVTQINNNSEQMDYGWAKVPLIPFKYKNKMIPLINHVKSLQDGINAITSTFQNNMEEDNRNTIMVLVNYDGTDLGEFRQNFAQYGVVKVSEGGDLKTLQVEVNSENYKVILELFKKALIENGKGFNADALDRSGTPNEMTIKSIFNDIDLDANGIEMEYQASLQELLWFVNSHLSNTGVGDFENDKVEIMFNRDGVIIESQVITDVSNSVDLSLRTRLKNHPYVTDVEEELRLIKEEQKEQMAVGADFGGTFKNLKQKVDVNE